MSTNAAGFRAKANFMKSWRPEIVPSNRDRLELYALHKQSVSGDAPTKDPIDASVADKAKLAAWRGHRGMAQAEAMQRYIEECDRQLSLYGNRDSTNNSSSPSDSNARGRTPMEAGSASGEDSTSQTPMYSSTPQNTPSNLNDNTNNDDTGVLLCPRGLAAIPLLCAAASESRSAYLARLHVTPATNGWWSKQEPLCLDTNHPLSTPEKLIIGFAELVERISLLVNTLLGEGQAVAAISPRVIQAFLWPVHNTFLSIWILWILICTYLGSLWIMSQTLLFGAKRTNTPLGRLFLEEINPSARAVESLCEQHQTIGVRLTGLVLTPMMMICDLANSVVARAGILFGSLVFVLVGIVTWWYWIFVLPWCAICGLVIAGMSGWCFGVIELSGN